MSRPRDLVLGVNFRVLHDGRFFKTGNVVKYETREVLLVRDVFPKAINKRYLEQRIMDDGGFEDLRELYYLEPGKTINQGLRKIDDEGDVKKMMRYAGWNKTVHLYVVRGQEAGPLEVRKSKIEGSNSVDHVEGKEVRRPPPKQPKTSVKLTPQSCPTTDAAVPNHGSSLQGGADLEGENSGDEILGSETSSDGDESDFRLTDYEDDDVDLVPQGFAPEANVVQDNGTETIEELADPIDEDAGYVSEELATSDESDGHGKQKKKYEVFNPKSGFASPIQMKSGLIFTSRQLYRKALIQFSIESKGDFYYLHNNPKKITAYCLYRCICKTRNDPKKKCECGKVLCHWKVLARKFGSDGSMQIKSIHPKHDCEQRLKNTHVTSIWLAEKYLEYYKCDPKWRISAFREKVLRKQEIEITYIQAWRGRLRAALMTSDNVKEEYGKVHDYAVTIMRTNKGSTAKVVVDIGDPQGPIFERLYVCMAACRFGFLKGCRDIIGLDGCHLKGAFTGQILVAVGQDGNNNIYPIAYAVVEAERLDTWLWFLNLVLDDVGAAVPTFISDRQKVLQ